MSERQWTFTNRKHGTYQRTCSLRYYWEVAGDPITDDYVPEETTAGELLMTWSVQAWRRYPDGLVPIYWYVEGPDDGDTRPTSDLVRESIFNILGDSIEGLPAFDLFAGTGALGLEALSRGASHATFV